MTTPVQISAPGTYTVNWRAVSADGHPITGSFAFSVGHVDTIVAVSLDVSTGGSARYLQPLGRWLHLLGLIGLIGPIVMILMLGHAGDAVLVRRLWRFARFGALVILPAAAVMLLAQIVGVSGSFIEAMRRDAVTDVLRTQWGTFWSIRVLLAVALIVLTHRMALRRSGSTSPSSSGLIVATTGLAILILATALNGHSAATPPVVLSVAIDWLHLTATGVWVGGLLTLASLVLPWSRTLKTPRQQEMLARVVVRFSNVSLVAVEWLILTGLYHTWAHVPGPEALLTTPYGQALVVKVALIALVLVPAAVNLLIVRPQLAKPAGDAHFQSWSTRLGRLVRFEAVVAVGIVGAAAVLTSLPPAYGRVVQELSSPPAVEEQPEITFAANAGSSYVKLGISPGQVGSNRIHLSVLSETGKAITDRAPRIRIEAAPSAGVSAWTVTAAPGGDGYVVTVDLAPAGQWTLQVLDIASSEASFSIRIPLRGAEEILALADAAMNRLHSAVEEITVATTGAEERIEYQTPDRMRRRSEGRDEIVIGSTRYVHHSAAMWHPEASEPFRWPVSALADGARDVVLLGTETLDGQECLVVQFVDSGGVHQRIWIAPQGWRVIQQIAVSRGSTVVTRYSGFDNPVNIAPP